MHPCVHPQALYRVVREGAGLRPSDAVVDLYCGTGSIGLALARHCAGVVGVEAAGACGTWQWGLPLWVCDLGTGSLLQGNVHGVQEVWAVTILRSLPGLVITQEFMVASMQQPGHVQYTSTLVLVAGILSTTF